MPVSPEVRAQVTERTEGACAFFHRHAYTDGTHMVHSDHQGMGGMPEDADCNQPEKLNLGCPLCHPQKLHAEGYKIVAIDMEHTDEDGHPDPILEVEDRDGVRVSHDQLYVHVLQRVKRLRAIIGTLEEVQHVEGSHAIAMLELYRGYDLLMPEASTPERFFRAHGFDSEVAIKEALAAEWLEQNELQWPVGLPTSFVAILQNCSQRRLFGTLDRKGVQDFLVEMVCLGKAEAKAKLADLGIISQVANLFLAFTDPMSSGGHEGSGLREEIAVDPLIHIYRAFDTESVLKRPENKGGDVVVMVLGRLAKGWTWKRGKEGGLSDADGNRLAIIDLTELPTMEDADPIRQGAKTEEGADDDGSQ